MMILVCDHQKRFGTHRRIQDTSFLICLRASVVKSGDQLAMDPLRGRS